MLVVGVALFLAVERTLVATQNPNFVPSAILLGAAIVPAAFLTFVYGRRLPYDVSPPVVLTAAFLGGIIGTVVAGTLEFDAQRDLGFLPMVGVGLIEETSKLIIPLAVLIFFARYRKQADGLLIGVAAGAGFAALETMGYAFVTLIQSKGSITDTVDVLLLRGIMSPAGHMAWTGISATALYAAAEAGWSGRARRRLRGRVRAGRRPAHGVGQPEVADRHGDRRGRQPGRAGLDGAPHQPPPARPSLGGLHHGTAGRAAGRRSCRARRPRRARARWPARAAR